MNRSARRLTVGLLSTALITAAGAIAGAPAMADTLPVRLVVGLKPGYDAKAAMPTLGRLGLKNAEAVGRQRNQLLAQLGAKTLSVPGNRVSSTLAALRADPTVAYASVDNQSHAFDVTPNDEFYIHQPEMSQIKVPAAWDTTTGSDVVVAVVDTGVAPVGDLAGKVLPGYDFFNYDSDPSDDGVFPHGTVVSSLIAGTGNNGTGMAGVCWQCKILPVKVLNNKGVGYDSDIAEGVMYAVANGAKIINMSLGGDTYDKTLANAIAYANFRGVLVVAAAGNENTSALSYPAALPDVLAVGATDTNKGGSTRASFSNYSKSWVDVAAPGIVTGMYSNGGYYGGLEGTSFSAPLVSGVAALVKSVHPDYNGFSLGSAIARSTVAGTNSWTKYGLVDAAKALTINADTTPPTIGSIRPGQLANVRGTIAVSAASLADNFSGVEVVELYVNGAYKGRSYFSPFPLSLNTTAYAGRISVQLKVTDKAGNSTMSGSRGLVVDNAKPKVTVNSWPANKAKISGNVPIKVTPSDATSGVAKVELVVNGKVVATDPKSPYALGLNVAKQAKTMKVYVRVWDKAGNYNVSATRTYYRR